ncbi:alginate export family protein [Caulobacter segnis]
MLLSGDLHLGSAVRVYGELGLHRDFRQTRRALGHRSRPPGRPGSVRRHRAPPTGGASASAVRSFSSTSTQRFIAVREAPNIRQSFDGVRVTRTGDRLKLDAFYLQPVVVSPGAFDDFPQPDPTLLRPLRLDQARFHQTPGRSMRLAWSATTSGVRQADRRRAPRQPSARAWPEPPAPSTTRPRAWSRAEGSPAAASAPSPLRRAAAIR